jgi:hypothetical protein
MMEVGTRKCMPTPWNLFSDPFQGMVARIADVIGEIIGFPPMRKFGSRILAVERWVAMGYVAVAAILEDASCIWIVKIRISNAPSRFLNNRDRI